MANTHSASALAQSQTDARYLPVQNFPGYRVGTDGSVWTCKRHGKSGEPRWVNDGPWVRMTPTMRGGYPCVRLFANGKSRRVAVHVLVLETFVGPCPEGMEGCHDPDPDTSNCQVTNLRWDTRKGNHADKLKHGTAQRGELAGSHKLTREKATLVKSLKGKMLGREIARLVGVSESTVSKINTGVNWAWLSTDDPQPQP